MNDEGGLNPFVPGRGRIPPYLAGRSTEQRKLLDLFAYLRAGEGAPRDAILSGPRGNGKTALLRWFQREIEARDTRCDVVWLTPNEITDLDQLATGLVPPSRFTALRPDSLSFSIGIGRLGWELGGQGRSLTLLLTARCKRRPLVLLLDEAHTLDRQVGQTLLNSSQTVSADAPFLMVMAGTPGLQRHLNDMSATFWSRGEKIGIGRLDAEASAQALTRPMAAAKPPISFDDDALGQVVGESQRYPYFLQLWGAALWSTATASRHTRIDQAVVAQAATEFGTQRSAYYEDRKAELEQADLLPLAASVARAFADRTTLRRDQLNAVHRRAVGYRCDQRSAATPRPTGDHRLRLEATRRSSLAARHSQLDALCVQPRARLRRALIGTQHGARTPTSEAQPPRRSAMLWMGAARS